MINRRLRITIYITQLCCSRSVGVSVGPCRTTFPFSHSVFELRDPSGAWRRARKLSRHLEKAGITKTGMDKLKIEVFIWSFVCLLVL